MHGTFSKCILSYDLKRAAAAEQQLERVRRQQQQQSAPSSLGEGDESALALGGEALASAEGRPAGSSLTLLLQERQERLARLELELSTKDRTVCPILLVLYSYIYCTRREECAIVHSRFISWLLGDGRLALARFHLPHHILLFSSLSPRLLSFRLLTY